MNISYSHKNSLNFLLTLNLVIYVLFFLMLGLSGRVTGEEQILLFGAFDSAFIFKGMLWLTVTSIFLHFGLVHLVFNMLALHQIGNLAIQFYSNKKIFVAYIIGGLTGNLFTLAYSELIGQRITSIGASGAVFSLLGLLIGGTIKKTRFGTSLPFQLRDFYPTLILAVLISLIPQVNWMAHLGGLALGIFLGFIFDNTLSYSGNIQRDNLIEKLLFYTSILILIAGYLFLILNLLFEIIKV